MPLYNFECAECGPFLSFLTMGDRNRRVTCVTCNRKAERVITAPSLGLMPSSRRKAHAINERSRHEPRVSRGRGHVCKSGCACGKPANRTIGKVGSTSDERPLLKSARKSPRPWMLGH